MSRLIDADELRSGLFHLEGETNITDRQLGYQAGWNDALMYGVLDAPTVDAVEVVRCKDCRHYYADPWGYGNCVFEGGVSRRTKESDFCSWGERKDEVEE